MLIVDIQYRPTVFPASHIDHFSLEDFNYTFWTFLLSMCFKWILLTSSYCSLGRKIMYFSLTFCSYKYVISTIKLIFFQKAWPSSTKIWFNALIASQKFTSGGLKIGRTREVCPLYNVVIHPILCVLLSQEKGLEDFHYPI